jgi:predicted lipoprotein with Yx(FWY)xxD motif
MGTSVRRASGGAGLGWIGRVTLATMLAGACVAATVGVASAQAAPAHRSRSAVVVAQRTRHHFGKILVTPRAGRALYFLPRGHCTARSGCLSIWPRLVMPKGKTRPRGAACLGTAKFGAHHQLQVTYHGKRLYLFVEDSGHSVRGNRVMGFRVAKVHGCPIMM